MKESTIYAPASATAKSGVVVIRISGPSTKSAIKAMASSLGPARYAKYTKIYHPVSKILIDECVSVFYPGPASFTGEDVLELSIHGGRAVLKLTLDALANIPDLRIAEPGEFSKRRFLNGKMDLTQAEGLMDLIDAETIAQHQQALRQLSGALGELCEDWRLQLLRNVSLIEAYIDFPEEDLPQSIIDDVEEKIAFLASQISVYLADDKRGEKLREGFYIAILGKTNAGKSSLMNALAKRDVAIVSNIAGTTRDVIEVHLDIAGYPVVIADTAGIRETSDYLEVQGIARSIDRAKNSDLKILVLDMTEAVDIDPYLESFVDKNAIIVFNKSDLVKDGEVFDQNAIKISAKHNLGIDQLLAKITQRVEDYFSIGGAPLLTRQRHRENLERCVQSLIEFNLSKDIELAAEDLRLSARYLSAITGKIDVEMILGEIFSNFCIGK